MFVCSVHSLGVRYDLLLGAASAKDVSASFAGCDLGWLWVAPGCAVHFWRKTTPATHCFMADIVVESSQRAFVREALTRANVNELLFNHGYICGRREWTSTGTRQRVTDTMRSC